MNKKTFILFIVIAAISFGAGKFAFKGYTHIKEKNELCDELTGTWFDASNIECNLTLNEDKSMTSTTNDYNKWKATIVKNKKLLILYSPATTDTLQITMLNSNFMVTIQNGKNYIFTKQKEMQNGN